MKKANHNKGPQRGPLFFSILKLLIIIRCNLGCALRRDNWSIIRGILMLLLKLPPIFDLKEILSLTEILYGRDPDDETQGQQNSCYIRISGISSP